MTQIDLISHIYPTKKDPSSGIFIQKEARLLQDIFEINLLIPSVLALPFQSQYLRSHNPVDEKFPIRRIKYLSFPKRRWTSITSKNLAFSLTPLLRNSKSEIIHIHWLFPAGFSIPYLKNINKPIVLTLHGGDWYSNQHRGIDSQIEQSLDGASAIITVGKKLLADLLEKYPRLKSKAFHIPHGIDSSIFKPHDKTVKKEELKWDLTKKHLLCVANLYSVKGVDVLLTAFSKSRSFKCSELHIVAPRRDPKHFTMLKEMIGNYGMEKKVHFYASMSESELLPFYQAADLFISPSRKEGFGLAIAESISCGTPVIATKSGGPNEIINDRNGTLIPIENSSEMASSIDTMLDHLSSFDPHQMNIELSNRFSTQKKIERLEGLYRQLLS